jgi:hypothetical protein
MVRESLITYINSNSLSNVPNVTDSTYVLALCPNKTKTTLGAFYDSLIDFLAKVPDAKTNKS